MVFFEVGFIYGILVGVFGFLGIFVGGWLLDYLILKGYMVVFMWVGLIVVCFVLFLYLGYVLDNVNVVIVVIGMGVFILVMLFGVVFVVI